jgi:hypothetical protein
VISSGYLGLRKLLLSTKECAWHLEACNESSRTMRLPYNTVVNLVFVVLSYSNCCIVVLTCVFRQELSMIIFSNFMLRASGTAHSNFF